MSHSRSTRSESLQEHCGVPSRWPLFFKSNYPRVCHRVMTASKVSKRYRLIFNRELRTIVEDALCQQMLRKLYQRKGTQRKLKRVARDIERLAESLHQIDPGTRTLLLSIFARAVQPNRRMAIHWFDDQPLRLAKFLLNDVGTIRKVLPQRKAAHRPAGSTVNRPLYSLIGDLHHLIVDEAAGELSVWYDERVGQLKGTLPVVLGILHEYLPGVIPEQQDLNYSILRRCLRQFKKP
jgi:hypothetical protein